MAVKVQKDLVQSLGSDVGGSQPKPSTVAPATTQQIAEQTGLTNINGLPTSVTPSVTPAAPTPTTGSESSTASSTSSASSASSTSSTSSTSSQEAITEVLGDGNSNTYSPKTTAGTLEEAKAENSAYYDMLDAKNTKPEYQKSSDTSSGAAAAEGTQYSWDKQGTDKAQNQYQQDVLKAKQDALANRQTIEQNALQYQQQSDMMKYSNNQNAEKVGWTGGYVLDQNRQMEYLKSSIQAQMYGAMELQKYGYDSALAAARLSYDMNQKEFAHKYYQDAVNVAIAESQVTGTYFSAETRDMMTQLNASDQELGDLKDTPIEEIEEGVANGTITLTPEQSRALEVKKNIESWYEANDVSKTGVKTLAAWEAEQSMAQQWANTQWEMYQAANDAANNKVSEDVNAFIMTDATGKPMYDGTEVKVGNWKTMSGEDIVSYISNEDGTINSEKQQQFYSYIDTQLGGQVSSGFAQYCTTNNIDPKNYDKEMTKYLGSSDAIGKFLTNKFANLSSDQAKALFENLNGYTIDIVLPDGKEHTYTLEVSTKNTFGNAGKTENTGSTKPDTPTIENIEDVKPTLDKTYETEEEVVDAFLDSDNFESISSFLDSVDFEKDPSTWWSNNEHVGGQWLSWFPIARTIVDGVNSGEYQQIRESLTTTRDTLIASVGEDNYKLMVSYYDKYAKMSDTEKQMLPTESKEKYEKIGKFVTKIKDMDSAIEVASRKDSNIIENPWDYVGDTWVNWVDKWSKTSNVSDVVTNVLDTVGAVVETAIGGVTGILKWITGNWFDTANNKETGERW